MTLAARLMAQARELGFDLLGVLPAGPTLTAGRYRAWLAEGYHGEMVYLARPEAVARRADPARILPGLRSVVALAANYCPAPLPAALRDDPARGIVARYAWGDDYHQVLLPRLGQLAAFVEAQTGGPVGWRAYVDSGPLLEREIAARAGLGFIGKNTHLIHPRLGSWLFLAELLLSVELPASGGALPTRPACGRCTRCLESCPTGALVAPYVLDARRCIAYLTIELKGPIPRELRPLLGRRIFGCDVCQEVCPWNRRFARPAAGAVFRPRPPAMAPLFLELLALDEMGFGQRFRGSPLARAKRRGLLRNVAVALGNWGDPAAAPALARALGDDEPLIREHAAWALGRLAGGEARQALRGALAVEQDARVCRDLLLALAASE